MTFLKRLFSSKREILPIVLISSFFGLIAQVISYIYDFNFAYRDAIYRLEAARRFTDSMHPGFIKQLGTVWLPITHIIMAPLAYFDFLWTTGLASGIVGFVSYVISCAFVYLILKKLLKDSEIIYLGTFIYLLNPSFLYFQTTALTEGPYLFFITASFYFILKWSENYKNIHSLIAGFFLMLAMGARYDAWIIFLGSFIIMFIFSDGFFNKIKSVFFFSIFPAVFLVFWFLYNLLVFGNMLEFSNGKYSTLAQLKYYEDAGRLPTKHNLFLSLDVTIKDIALYAGLIIAIFFIAGFVIYFIKNKFNKKSFLPYLLFIPVPSLIFLLYYGQIIIELPWTNPEGYFNSRYAIYLLPAFAFFSAYFINYLFERKWKSPGKVKKIIYGFLIVQVLLFVIKFPYFVPGVAEADYCNNETTQKFNKFLRENYDGGNVFYDFAIFALPPTTRVHIKDRLTYYTPFYGRDALQNPQLYAKYIFTYKLASNDSVYFYLKDNESFKTCYDRIFTEEGLEIYRLKEK